MSVAQRGRRLVVGIPLGWLIVLFLVPFLIVLKLSFSETRLAIPPYAPFLIWIKGVPHPALHLNNYAFLFTDPLYVSCLLYTSPSPRDRQKSRMPSSA